MNTVALMQLVQARGVGNATIRRLAEYSRTQKVSPDEVVRLTHAKMASVLGVKEEVAEEIAYGRGKAECLSDELEVHGISLLWLNDPQYPLRTKVILGKDAPSILFVRGDMTLLQQSAVGFCGSRKASEKGLIVAMNCAKTLAENGITVVSGYAHGVDMAAHFGAVTNGGSTVLVLAEGILRYRNKSELAESLTAQNHVIVSQFPPMLPWSARNAMTRNGTIIGLSDAMVLVESGMRGGTFAAGMETLERNSPLFVIDFAEPGPSAEANPHFISLGGKPVRGRGAGRPNLTELIATVRQPRWMSNMQGETLF